ncbi:LLM class F420-dependent oxidoreductase [Actinomadura sp. HBU206391]|uniref:LLM class F420-dependent oxidoreductase n=1 Tax=Actinomadura sp. HBU206391 TaxID=2731692 RepID=UPI001650A6CA|nr:LLM class F420-dependent oxidoreductase [Actinomadura sp. HBU206391]MBC6459252.1 LLM class F420-dependent oxidoreductase [Actinomadura sp. HBU206391]
MEIGIAVGDVRGPATLEELVGQVRTAADAGFGMVWSSQAFGWDALTALAVVGGRVPGIGLGSAVVPIPQRHPLVLASQALSVQAAVGDRLTLGIGAGIAMMVRGMFGLAADRPARRMREYLSVLGPLLRGESVTYQGETLTAVGAVNVPGAKNPQVLVAALGPSMLRLAGELADGTVTWMTGPRTLAEHIVPSITKAAESAGRPAPRVAAGLVVCVTAGEVAVRERIAEEFALAGQVPEYRAVLDREGAAGPQDVVIVGDEDAVARQLGRLADAGVTEFIASPYGSAEEQGRTIAVLADLAASGAWTEMASPVDQMREGTQTG